VDQLRKPPEKRGNLNRYRIREIALQAGLSEATVDRVLNRRGGVRASTEREVHRAIADLETSPKPAQHRRNIDELRQSP
jgi:DNA-binding LacI/PurR family transcriptional regulator